MVLDVPRSLANFFNRESQHNNAHDCLDIQENSCISVPGGGKRGGGWSPAGGTSMPGMVGGIPISCGGGIPWIPRETGLYIRIITN